MKKYIYNQKVTMSKFRYTTSICETVQIDDE